MMPDIFKEIIPSILQTKKSVIHDDIDAKAYAPYIVNRALSYHLDCVPFVNEMNMYPGIDKDMQYQYYLNSIRSMKRKFQPWQKSSKVENIECVKTFFGYSDNKAKEALLILSDEQIAEIKIITDKGGMK
jgi:hypothetical protein